MSARTVQTRLSNLSIRRAKLQLSNPTSFAARVIEREMDELRAALKAQLGEAA